MKGAEAAAIIDLSQPAALSPDELAVLEGIAAHILPSSGTPGATEAHVIDYVCWLSTQSTFRTHAGLMTRGVAVVNRLAQTAFRTAFVQCSNAEQDQILRLVSTSADSRDRRFFQGMLNMTLAGFLCPPKYGGNANLAGWRFVGLDHYEDR